MQGEDKEKGGEEEKRGDKGSVDRKGDKEDKET